MHSFIKKAGISLLLSLGAASLAQALPADFQDKLNADSRPAEDKARDAARRPGEVLTLLGITEGSTVVDISAGGGWYTRVLSAAVGPNGKVLSQVGTRPLQNNNGQAARDMAASLGNVDIVFDEVSAIPAGTADYAVTALNLHDQFNFRGEEGAMNFLTPIFNVLKSGGKAVIIDHEGDEGAANGDLHRLPTDTARMLIEKAGFEIVEESDILDNSADDHSLSSNDDSLGRNTDRFLFIVQKP